MICSILDIFKIGIGPSSSHTMGPMIAAKMFADELARRELLTPTASITAEFFGSLGLTGRGHQTHRAAMLGLSGEKPASALPEKCETLLDTVRQTGRLKILGRHEIPFDSDLHLHFYQRRSLPLHANGLRFTAIARDGAILLAKDFYSIGGGFVVSADDWSPYDAETQSVAVPLTFDSAQMLLARCRETGFSIADVVLHNETIWRSDAETRSALRTIWTTMESCIRRGLTTEGELPGQLRITRRAAVLYRALDPTGHHSNSLERLSAYAIAVNEENAAGHQVVTAPTNGAAGIIPAVLAHYSWHHPHSTEDGVVTFLATAGAIGTLYKRNASISGAEMGCQGEVGVACSMAAAGLAAALGATNEQIENAAEIGMEHNLGLTCDPVGGLVQIPCIERNAMGAVKAVNAAQLALRGNGRHHVTLDQVIATMRQTGLDMASKYKETSLGGLAVNVPSC
ncbi:MAG: L-serine ammonia-lyase [Gammaproteobacteria bacterium]|nr:L-serine ammonia-lyase [Gammaproteobacteria bacterium]